MTAVKRNEKVDEALAMLQEGLEDIKDSKELKNYLRCMAKFSAYSEKNSMLIYKQFKEAQFVAGYKTWQELNRHVKRGEKGIRILAPIKRKSKDKSDEDEKVCGYRAVYIFDISQTEGEDLPEFSPKQLTDADPIPDYDGFVDAICQVTPYSVQFEDLPDEGTNGLASHLHSRITIRPNMPQTQTVKTLLHEVAHSLLHGMESVRASLVADGPDLTLSSVRETEAESVAYVVSQYFGIDTADYSIPYITLWSGQNAELLKKSLNRIYNAACDIIQKLNSLLKKENHPLYRADIFESLNPVQ